MKFPTIHLNGTSGTDLLEENLAVADALRTLQAAIINAGPNGRDYYVQGPDALSEAQREHQDRLQRVQSLVQDYNAIIENISDQIDQREATKRGAIRRFLPLVQGTQTDREVEAGRIIREWANQKGGD